MTGTKDSQGGVYRPGEGPTPSAEKLYEGVIELGKEVVGYGYRVPMKLRGRIISAGERGNRQELIAIEIEMQEIRKQMYEETPKEPTINEEMF